MGEEMRWHRYVPGETALSFGATYLCAGKNGRIFTEMLTAGLSADKWGQVAWISAAREIPRPPAKGKLAALRTQAQSSTSTKGEREK